ncbi:response regulator transcription factor [Crassaminicella profunda]|uniref:response regulator transcription factor n=1 Tax=Crassaminicella profunda TaxID=1286698 RepID=UPI001CA6F19A|nr:response regulator transcription factor [Crassaminicella profunda]QZY55185.1 response regulator transcription factor [Crassaminicella profunda]
MAKILVLEDEIAIRSFIKIKLKALGHDVIDTAYGKEALQKADERVDIALLDVMLPDMDGMEVCRKLRIRYPNLGIIMLTAKGQEKDKIEGLGSGADDYMVKPFSPKELAARINALLRRLNLSNQGHKFIYGPYEMNIDQKILKKNREIVPLTPTEYAILELLMKNSNKAVSRDEILDHIWGNNYIGDIKTVDVHVRRLRQKIEESPSNPIYLKAVWGYGYIWSVEE